MIVQLRVDERFVHGQVTTQCSRILAPDIILVVNDKVAQDKITSQSLLMAQPAGIKVRIRGVKDAIDVLKDPRADTKKFMLIVNNLDDAITLLENVEIKSVNIANYRVKKEADKVAVTTTIHCSGEDIEKLKKITTMAEDVFHQLVPGSTKQDMKGILNKL